MIKTYINNKSDQSEIKDAIISNIRNARYEILVALYIFTDIDILNALEDFMQRNKNGRVILLIDDQIKNENADISDDINNEILLMMEKYPDRFECKVINGGNGLMHHKLIIIDRYLYGIGSYNYSRSADLYNYESYLFITLDEEPKELSKLYYELYNIIGKPIEEADPEYVDVKYYPVLVFGDSNDYHILSREAPDVLLYPTQLLLEVSGKNITTYSVKYNDTEKIYHYYYDRENKVVINPSLSQYIEINFFGYSNKVITKKKYIQVDYKKTMKWSQIETFYRTSSKIIEKYERTADELLLLYENMFNEIDKKIKLKVY